MHADRAPHLAAVAVALVAVLVTATADAEPGETTIEVAVGSSRHLRLGKEIARMSPGDADIANIAAFPPDQLLITGRRPGHTTATVWLGSEVRVLLIDVGYPVAAMQAALARALPHAENLAVTSAGAAVVIAGEVAAPEEIERAELIVRAIAGPGGADAQVINTMTIGGNQQVQLEVSFAEVSRSSLRAIGVNFWSKDISASTGNGYGGGVLAPTTGLAEAAPELSTTPDVGNLNHLPIGFDDTGKPLSSAVPLLAAPLAGTFGFVFSSTLGGFPFSAALSLLSSRGYARTLAEPTLVAMSGKTASFLAGGEFPIPLPQSLGQVAVEYRKFGIQLSFTPTVSGDDIQLDLGVTVSDIDASLGVRLASIQVPGLRERHSQTTVRLRDGQSFVVAGLLSDEVRSTVDKVPWLGDLPILGALFRSSSYRRDETELLVVVTAHRVQPMDQKPRLPGEDTTTDPGDLELFLLGRGESVGPGRSRAEDRARRPAGAVGFAR
jgi:pilus assembly protein CpaC